MAYVDPGLMTEIIDVWDQPPNSKPIVFVEGIHAQKTEIANTTQSPVSAALGQNIAWPRLVGQDVSLVTTVFVIQYVPGIRSRMFILHHHPDDGLVRYDLDRPVDIDGQRHQLNLLTFKRADGADPFDAQLTSTLDILSRDTASGDKRGISDPTFTTIATGIPCRVAEGKTAQKGKEVRTKSTVALAYREVYMRPWFLDPAPDGSFVPFTVVSGITYNTKPLTHNHWLLIPSSTAVNSNREPIPGEQYDITEIANPGLAHHHLEVSCEVVLP
jgi:hypothetical protein